MVVVDKPPGLVVHPGAGNPDRTLVNGLLHRFPELAGVGDPARPGIVHRLDAGSSGLLVVARPAAAAAALVEQFAAHTAGRRYDAVVWGHPDAPHGIIDAPIGRDPSDPLKMAVVVDGKRARTEYQVVERDARRPAELARLQCTLETGRTHQIRVHLAAVGHPLVGDPTYGDRRTTLGLRRPFLHAAELTFDHPATGERADVHQPAARGPGDVRRRSATGHLTRCVQRPGVARRTRSRTDPAQIVGWAQVGAGSAAVAGHGALPWAIAAMSASV